MSQIHLLPSVVQEELQSWRDVGLSALTFEKEGDRKPNRGVAELGSKKEMWNLQLSSSKHKILSETPKKIRRQVGKSSREVITLDGQASFECIML